jgi:hypothetical protein
VWKRFGISLEVRDYDELPSLAERHELPPTLQHVVNGAIQRLLRAAKDLLLALEFAHPLASGEWA